MNQPATTDRRRRFRYETGDIAATLDESEIALIDLSLTGVGVHSAEQLKEGEVHMLHMNCEAGGLEAEVVVVWCNQRKTKGANKKAGYRAGLRFPPLPTEKADFLYRVWRWQSQRSAVQPDEREEENTSEFEIAAILERVR